VFERLPHFGGTCGTFAEEVRYEGSSPPGEMVDLRAAPPVAGVLGGREARHGNFAAVRDPRDFPSSPVPAFLILRFSQSSPRT